MTVYREFSVKNLSLKLVDERAEPRKHFKNVKNILLNNRRDIILEYENKQIILVIDYAQFDLEHVKLLFY